MNDLLPLHEPADEGCWKALLLAPSTRIDTYLTGFMQVPAVWELKQRRVDEHLLYFIQDEVARAEIGADSVQLLPGSLMWLSPELLHSATLADPQGRVTLYHFRFQVIAEGYRWALPMPCIVRHGVWELQHLAAQYHDDGQLPGDDQNDRLRALLYLLYTGLQRAPGHSPDEADGPTLTYADRRRLEDYSRHHLADWPAPADLARVLQLSPDYFTRVFRRTYGIPPRSWLMRERLRAAAARLADSTHNVTEIAREFGYRDLTLFSRQFRQVMGVSPRHYRRRH